MLGPRDLEVLESSYELILGLWVGPGDQGTYLELPPLAGAVGPVDPGDLPQGDLLIAVDPVHPEGDAVALHADGDALPSRDDVTVGVGQGGDTPVGVVVAADDGEAGHAVEELDAGLDPLGRAGGGVGEAEDEAGLVELDCVGAGEGDGGGLELGEVGLAEGADGGFWVSCVSEMVGWNQWEHVCVCVCVC